MNQCAGKIDKEHLADKAGDGTSIDLRVYSECVGGTEVRDYVVADGGHAWPGGEQYLPERMIGKTSKNLDASGTIWEFFSRHSR